MKAIEPTLDRLPWLATTATLDTSGTDKLLQAMHGGVFTDWWSRSFEGIPHRSVAGLDDGNKRECAIIGWSGFRNQSLLKDDPHDRIVVAAELEPGDTWADAAVFLNNLFDFVIR